MSDPCPRWAIGLSIVGILLAGSIFNFAWSGLHLDEDDINGPIEVTNNTLLKYSKIRAEQEAMSLRNQLELTKSMMERDVSSAKASAAEAEREAARLAAELSALKAELSALKASAPGAAAAPSAKHLFALKAAPRAAAAPSAAPDAKARRASDGGQAAARGSPDEHRQPEIAAEQVRCQARLFEALRSLYDGNATDVVIGANDGKRPDPAKYLEYWPQYCARLANERSGSQA